MAKRLPCRECVEAKGMCGLCGLSNAVLDAGDAHVESVTKRTRVDNAETTIIRGHFGQFNTLSHSGASSDEIATLNGYFLSFGDLMNGVKNSLKQKGQDIGKLKGLTKDLTDRSNSSERTIKDLTDQIGDLVKRADDSEKIIEGMEKTIGNLTKELNSAKMRIEDLECQIKYKPERYRPINFSIRWANDAVMNLVVDHIDHILDAKTLIRREGGSIDMLVKDGSVLDDTMMIGDVIRDGDVIDGMVLGNQNLFSIGELRMQIEYLVAKVLENEKRLL